MKTLTQVVAALPSIYPPGFRDLMAFVLPHETVFPRGHAGDYDLALTENDSRDPGGETKFGLDARSHPCLDVSDLTVNQAIDVYYKEIWRPLRAGELPAQVALALCDAAINCGTARAVRWLQEVAGATVDGNLGPKTIAAVKAMNPDTATGQLNARRMNYYTNEVRPALRAAFLAGWTNRVNDLDAALTQINNVSARPA